MQKPTKPCWNCGSTDWWPTPDGRYLCNRCHPNPNPSSTPPSNPGKEGHALEVLALRDRVILGNRKLNDAWEQIKKIADDKERWSEEVGHWHQANEKLSILCTQLEALGYKDCLYLDGQGKKTVRCLEQGGIGCRVCPSKIPYWEQELMELPGPGKE